MIKTEYLIIILIVVVICLLYAVAVHECIYITPDAKREFIKYINSHEKAKEHETLCSKIPNIIENIDDYFKFELTEKDHTDVVEMIKENNGIFSKRIMRRWIKENYHENYIENNKECRND